MVTTDPNNPQNLVQQRVFDDPNGGMIQGRFIPFARWHRRCSTSWGRIHAIERQLAHEERDESCASYNHAQYLDERRRFLVEVVFLAFGQDVVVVGDIASGPQALPLG